MADGSFEGFRAHRTFFGLFLLCLALYALRMGDGILLEDHARYASVAKSILSTGDWVTMHETPDRLYFNKPPLYFWLTASLFSLFGPVVWAARFFSVAAGIGSVLLVFALTRRFWGERTAFWAALALALSNDFLRYASVGRLDAPQVFFMILAVYGMMISFFSTSRWGALLPGVSFGLGMLVKGPLIFSLIPLLLLMAGFSHLLHSRSRQKTDDSLPPPWGILVAGLLSGVVIALPWFLAVAAKNAEFAPHYFGHEMVDRVQGDWLAAKGRLSFLSVLVVHGIPWILLLPWGIRTLLFGGPSGDREESGRTIYPTALRWLVPAWMILMLLVAFLPPRMYGRYLMIVLPPMAILAGIGFSTLAAGPGRAGRIFHWFDLALRRHLLKVAVVAGLAILLIPFDRHQSGDQLNLAEATPIIKNAYSLEEQVPLFHSVFHAPEAVLYFYTDRESRQMSSLEEALHYPLVVTSEGGLEQLAPHGYRAVLRARKLVLAERDTAEKPDSSMRVLEKRETP